MPLICLTLKIDVENVPVSTLTGFIVVTGGFVDNLHLYEDKHVEKLQIICHTLEPSLSCTIEFKKLLKILLLIL